MSKYPSGYFRRMRAGRKHLLSDKPWTPARCEKMLLEINSKSSFLSCQECKHKQEEKERSDNFNAT